MKAICVTFLTAPILNDVGDATKIDIPIALEAGKSWSWLAVDDSGSTPSWTQKNIPKNASQKIFKSAQKAYEGWLQLSASKPTPPKEYQDR